MSPSTYKEEKSMRSTEEIKRLYNENKKYIMPTIRRNFNNPEFLALHGITREELIQSGRIGLYRACQTYDESKGTTFRTYAIDNIKWAISDEAKRDSLGRAEKWTFDLVDRISFDMELDHVNDEVVSLYDLVGEEEQGYEELEVEMEMERKLKLIEEKLPERLATIVKLRAQGYTTMEIGEKIGTTHQNVSQLLRYHKDKIKALIAS